MDTETTVVISSVVLGAVQIAKQFGCQRGAGLIIALVMSLAIVLLYAISHETHFERSMIWGYTTGFIAVAGTAIGIHSAAKNTKEIVEEKQISNLDPRRFLSDTKGTGDGKS